MYKRNKHTPEQIPEFFDKKIVNDEYAVAITLKFDHGTSEYDSVRMRKQIDDLMKAINDDYFSQATGKIRRLYFQKRNKNVQFSVIGYVEDLSKNYHVHLLLRPAIDAVIDQTFIDNFTAHWHRICSLCRQVEFGKYDSGEQECVQTELRKRSATLKDGIRKADIGWANYFTKKVRLANGKLWGDCEIFV